MYYVVVSNGWIHDRFECGDDADGYIEHYYEMFPQSVGTLERLAVEA